MIESSTVDRVAIISRIMCETRKAIAPNPVAR